MIFESRVYGVKNWKVDTSYKYAYIIPNIRDHQVYKESLCLLKTIQYCKTSEILQRQWTTESGRPSSYVGLQCEVFTGLTLWTGMFNWWLNELSKRNENENFHFHSPFPGGR